MCHFGPVNRVPSYSKEAGAETLEESNQRRVGPGEKTARKLCFLVAETQEGGRDGARTFSKRIYGDCAWHRRARVDGEPRGKAGLRRRGAVVGRSRVGRGARFRAGAWASSEEVVALAPSPSSEGVLASETPLVSSSFVPHANQEEGAEAKRQRGPHCSAAGNRHACNSSASPLRYPAELAASRGAYVWAQRWKMATRVVAPRSAAMCVYFRERRCAGQPCTVSCQMRTGSP